MAEKLQRSERDDISDAWERAKNEGRQDALPPEADSVNQAEEDPDVTDTWESRKTPGTGGQS
jgi:hypothetical protein